MLISFILLLIFVHLSHVIERVRLIQGILQSLWLGSFVFSSISERFWLVHAVFCRLSCSYLLSLQIFLDNSMMLGFSFVPHSHQLVVSLFFWEKKSMVILSNGLKPFLSLPGIRSLGSRKDGIFWNVVLRHCLRQCCAEDSGYGHGRAVVEYLRGFGYNGSLKSGRQILKELDRSEVNFRPAPICFSRFT